MKNPDSSKLCFNGAVTFSLRKFIVRNSRGMPRNKLQWGRNFFVTEIEDNTVVLVLESGFNGAVTFSLRKFARISL